MNHEPVRWSEAVPEWLRVWHQYSPEVKVDLTATAFAVPAGHWVVVDPVGPPEALCWSGGVRAVWLTNGNHWRTSTVWRERFGCPIFAPMKALATLEGIPDGTWAGPGSDDHAGITVERVELSGAGPGELAFWLPDRRCMVIGDAVINLPEYPLQMLPERYCADSGRLRDQLTALARKLQREPEAWVSFAHGEPVCGWDWLRRLPGWCGRCNLCVSPTRSLHSRLRWDRCWWLRVVGRGGGCWR